MPPDWDDLDRVVRFSHDGHTHDVGASGEPSSAKELAVDLCPKPHAVNLVKRWHSRLPNVQKGPWTHAFHIHWNGYTYGVALWNNPSARTLPNNWLELRRMAIAPDAPKFTASRMLGQMARWFRANRPDIERLISYQDEEVHQGTIYKAANWTRAYYSKPRVRSRGEYVDAAGNTRKRGVRHAINGPAADTAGKWRWELEL